MDGLLIYKVAVDCAEYMRTRMTVKRSVKIQDSIAGAVRATFEREEELLISSLRAPSRRTGRWLRLSRKVCWS